MCDEDPCRVGQWAIEKTVLEDRLPDISIYGAERVIHKDDISSGVSRARKRYSGLLPAWVIWILVSMRMKISAMKIIYHSD